MKTIAIIPARGGSKGLVGKNLLSLNGKPLIAYTIESAIRADIFDQIIVTTDSVDIRRTANQYGASTPFLRPERLATDTASTIEVVQHAVDEYFSGAQHPFEKICVILLQPTSPLRTSDHIKEAFSLYIENKGVPVLSVCEAYTHPLLLMKVENNRIMKYSPHSSINRRQDFPPLYQLNGAIYISDSSLISQGYLYKDLAIPFFMKKEDSIDIDDELDFQLASYVLTKRSDQHV
ncbi:acylneuraminate cytidylyltransferase family protein [Falsibacillus albus]|uniref:Acylneuraminate cytidylyltransferase family protein n=1 Tax=Falsibacillus albus TaxID=2478915 RepID=A0A3L7K917_9BACI|nr:acylneuraminate cytidylyltransferase family protein [Falsibacillus albus]RLQ97142.1 acylneuraminate cytidylyltransferase family protein [Falsibacillus albus]